MPGKSMLGKAHDGLQFYPMPSKLPKRMTATSLANIALAYLARFSTSSANLRQVLRRRIMRSTAHHGDDPAPMIAALDELIARYERSGLLNDERYAEAQIVGLRRRGGSARAIANRLGAKGIDGDTIHEALREPGDALSETEAAVAFARRRRLGPFRTQKRDEYRMRDLAALGRGGFDYRMAVRIVDAKDIDSLDEIINSK